MSFLRIWSYLPARGSETEFAAAYGQDGPWVALFLRGAGYLGTELLRGAGGRWMTIDRWRSREDWAAFLATHRAEYDALDRECAGLTLEEADHGEWEVQ